jgi:hypothetical protein
METGQPQRTSSLLPIVEVATRHEGTRATMTYIHSYMSKGIGDLGWTRCSRKDCVVTQTRKKKMKFSFLRSHWPDASQR